ncbi:MAG: cell division protein FtsA [Candidatus Nealsonbacteria bacterium CG_4_9_14_3_um_filter_35_11]|uniref:Cell division protein FtsA n=1 Tax=Candidatus Nealsonbacteria bacterium CG11_big_fil_rev_8_21_14_0_20_35_11 TaxID=1974713 RepID=A0A2H0N0C3_9BACT|nr:MAG: cell division protein FtsA [Candidatus Nealsonbacteria bacterium CG11_big_fil_rev_8_21_14_0_20_35_11]PIZ89733.1 MAG: cell division protein FtsA [Candidatus Nealsonbacteria bacterium CG_4_10_14_0_2_um_filter_35_20]PJA84663.1 MAG: cell division protein FtsA [Candidatus Nealsonbacteria bacterium CG_4_9_14_3_um_filter_35_11]
MARHKIITGLDIGTDTIKILAACKNPKNEDFKVLFFDKINSFGLQKGRVINPQEVTNKISSLISKLQKTYNQRIDSAFINVNGSKLQIVPNHGLISVSPANQKVCQEDIDRILQETQNINLPSNREILDIFPKEWILDGEREIKDPLALQGVRLEVEASLLSAFSPDLENLTEAVTEAGLQVEDIIPSSLAASSAVLSPYQKELGVALLDIGAATCGLAVFEEGVFLDLSVFPVGSANITNDIAIGLRTEIDIAEKIKKDIGSCISLSQGSKKKKVEINPSNFLSSFKKEEVGKEESKKPFLTFSEKQLRKIIEARVGEIFELVQKELKKISRQGLLPAGIVLTGGGAKLPGIVEMAKRELKLPCKLGYPRNFSGLEKDCSLATVCGLVLEGQDVSQKSLSFGLDSRGLGAKIKRIFRIFIP